MKIYKLHDERISTYNALSLPSLTFKNNTYSMMVRAFPFDNLAGCAAGIKTCLLVRITDTDSNMRRSHDCKQ